jgi:hypothetical protein
MIGVQGAVHRQGQLAGFKPNAFFHTYGEFANNAAKAKSIGLVVTLTTLVADRPEVQILGCPSSVLSGTVVVVSLLSCSPHLWQGSFGFKS